MRILTEHQENLLNDIRILLSDLRTNLVSYKASREDQEVLAQALRQLDEFFLLVIVGEFNSGKSAFINALLGQRVLKEGVTPTTTQINLLRYGETLDRNIENEHLYVLSAPVDLLREMSIVDTPGTNAIIREHEEITSQFVPRSDLVLFVTSADRPFTESERAFLEQIRAWGKKVIIVLNKIDLFQNEAELGEVEAFIKANAQAFFGAAPDILPVSARLALRAKLGEPQYWQPSRFEILEGYIQEKLDEKGRLRLKFLNPLGIGVRLVEKHLSLVENRLDLLKADFSMLENVEGQLAVYQEDMRRDFNFRMSDVEKVLYEMDQRGQEYFEETMRLARIFDLLNKNRVQEEFEKRVVADVPQRLETKVNELIDWLVENDLRQWQAVMDHVADRRRQHQEQIIGDDGSGSFHYDRQRLMDDVGKEAQSVVETYDRTREAEKIASGAQSAVAALAAVEVGALSIGALVTILATTLAADVTGILLASVVALLGLFVIPARRRQAKTEMRTKITALRQQLLGSLQTHFEKEMQRSIEHIQTAITPYSRFVRSEQNKLSEAQTSLEKDKISLERLKGQVEILLGEQSLE